LALTVVCGTDVVYLYEDNVRVQIRGHVRGPDVLSGEKVKSKG
jgi:hypothetical protein